MLRRAAGLLAILSFVLIAGCGSNTPAPAGPAAVKPETTLTLNGKTYTCESVAGVAEGEGSCSAEAQDTFDLYKGNIDSYVNGGRLGKLGEEPFTLEDRAYAGLAACAHQKRSQSQQDFVAFMLSEEAFKNLSPGDLTPAWSEASKSLCNGYPD